MRDPVRHAFFDASVYLSLFGLKPRELKEVAKLAEIIEAGHLVVYLTTQVEREVQRRRAGVIADLLEPLKSAQLRLRTPALVQGMAQASALTEHLGQAEQARDELLAEALGAARTRSLAADGLVDRLCSRARRIESERYFERASRRRGLNHPPGKKGSLGDASNWEALLGSVEQGDDLHLVTSDSDFCSPLEPDQLDEFLDEEWRRVKGSTVRFHRTFLAFLHSEYPGIDVATDVWQHLLIESLGRTQSFDETHRIVGRLQQASLNGAGASRLLALALDNPQVRWIAEDSDVRALIEGVMLAHGDSLPTDLVRSWRMVLEGKVPPYGPRPNADDSPPDDRVGP